MDVSSAQTPETNPSPGAETPDRVLEAKLNLQRKAALAFGGARDHAGRVEIARMERFDMSRTIFGGLEGLIPRLVMEDKLAKEARWDAGAAAEVEAEYTAHEAAHPVPAIDHRLIDFMVDECDFSMEHADGTFLEHLVFCHNYAFKYFPGHSPNIALLHSILGTGTNTFAMKAEKIPQLKSLLTDEEFLQVETFPTTLRLLYDQALLAELGANVHRLDKLDALHCHRVIDNAPIALDMESFWVNLNFHLMHFVDFMPAANWATHRGDPLLQMFEALSNLLDEAGQRRAQVQVNFPQSASQPQREALSVVGRISGAMPRSITQSMARKSIRKYSNRIGHDLSYRLEWR